MYNRGWDNLGLSVALSNHNAFLPLSVLTPAVLGPRGGTGLRSGLKIRRSEDLVGSNPTEGIHTIRTLKNVDRDFFRTWTPDMAYVLGYIVADGLCYAAQGEEESCWISRHS